MRARSLIALAVLPLAVAACGSSSNTDTSGGGSGGGGGGTVNGAGSTFAAPIYSQWGNALKSQGLTVNYQPVGSGAGVAQFAAGTVDFGASDPALLP
ncbi:MAG: phosphate transport system substrate-binding protein, partial [Thermoleophilaceae bacterium]|nr:phosphate transport system substrate-binding protein [Thermoleophilaceae bacterium]